MATNMRVDFHTHILPRSWPDWCEAFGYPGFVFLDHDQSKVATPGNARMMKSGEFFREIEPNCWDLDHRLADMNRDKIDVQVLCTVPVMFSYWAKAQDAAEVARFLNDDLAKEVAKHPRRFIGLGTLPMQDAELAVKELRRCVVELKFPGVQIGSHVNDDNLNDSKFDPFWKAAEELGACIFIHPWDMDLGGRNEKFWLPWLVGMPAETCHAVVCILMGGVLEKFPNLKIVFAHGAGSFPFTLHRINHGYACRPDLCATDCSVPPKSYVGNKIYCDSIVHDSRALKFLVDVMGEDKVVFGTDYPFPLGEVTGSAPGVYPGVAIDECKDLSMSTKRRLLAENALEFMGLSSENYGCVA